MDGDKKEWFRARTGGHKRTLVAVKDQGSSGSEEDPQREDPQREDPQGGTQEESPQVWEELCRAKEEIARQAQELQAAAARMAAQDEAIQSLREELTALKGALRATATAKTGGTATKVAAATAKTGGVATKMAAATPTTPPKHAPQHPQPQPRPQAWQGQSNNPAPLMQMVKGKARRAEETPRARATPASRKEAREEDIALFKQGMARADRGLKTLFIKGVARMPYGRLREILKKLGIPSAWVRNLAFAGQGVLELLVFSERAEEIQEIILKDATALGAAPDFDPLKVGSKEMAQRVGRLERDLKRLPPQMHMVRRELTKKLLEAKTRLQAAKTEKVAATAAEAEDAREDVMPGCDEVEAPVVGTEMLAEGANV
jgi:hypothetical protein